MLTYYFPDVFKISFHRLNVKKNILSSLRLLSKFRSYSHFIYAVIEVRCQIQSL